MGKNITHVGNENGAGQTCKVANQIIVALNIAAVGEALLFASKAGTEAEGSSVLNCASASSYIPSSRSVIPAIACTFQSLPVVRSNCSMP